MASSSTTNAVTTALHARSTRRCWAALVAHVREGGGTHRQRCKGRARACVSRWAASAPHLSINDTPFPIDSPSYYLLPFPPLLAHIWSVDRVFDEMPESNISVDVYQSICYVTMFQFLGFSIYGPHKLLMIIVLLEHLQQSL
jgi:hypothetical protein